MSPYQIVYGKACHLPLELEHKAHWALKKLNWECMLQQSKGNFNFVSLMNYDYFYVKMQESIKR